MTTIEKIYRAIAYFEGRTGFRSTHIYLGKKEACELRDMVANCRYTMILKNDTVREGRLEVNGLLVFEVNEDSHVHVTNEGGLLNEH